MINILILIAICYLKVSYLISNWLKERDVITNKNIGRKSFNLEETRLKFTVGDQKNEIEFVIKDKGMKLNWRSKTRLSVHSCCILKRLNFFHEYLLIRTFYLSKFFESALYD